MKLMASTSGAKFRESWNSSTMSRGGTANNAANGTTTISKAEFAKKNGPLRKNDGSLICTQSTATAGPSSRSSSKAGNISPMQNLELCQEHAVFENAEVSKAAEPPKLSAF